MKNFEYMYACEGLQEQLYLEHISNLIEYERPDIKINFIKLKNIIYLERYPSTRKKVSFYDYDLNQTEFTKRAKLCKKSHFYYSNLNFDLWLLLHKRLFNKPETKNDAYVPLVRTIYHLPKDADIKNEDTIKKILSQISLDDIRQAIKNAESIMKNKLDSDKIVVNNNFCYYDNPSMNIHTFFKDLLIKCDLF